MGISGDQSFAEVCDSGFIFGTITSTFWPNFGGNNWWIKSVIFNHFRAFWEFLAIKEPLGSERELFSKSENVTLYPLLCCNFMQKFRKIQWLAVEKSWRGCTDGRKHGIGWIVRSQFRLKSRDQQQSRSRDRTGYHPDIHATHQSLEGSVLPNAWTVVGCFKVHEDPKMMKITKKD